MKYDLTSVGIHTNLQYECITTTINSKKEKNSAAFAFIYLGEDKVMCRIFEGSKSLENIQKTRQYVVNITQDPLVFTLSTIDKLPDEYYTDDEDIAILKDSSAYMLIDVDEIEMKTPEDFPIKNDTNIYFITGTIKDFVIRDESVKAFNRGFSGLIESLVNCSRYKIVDGEKRKYYKDRLDENRRVIEKVSDEKTKKAMEILAEEYEKN
ncbi:DUF447 domain-containing protein [uncultured Methanobrevibacter sp.]|uniref:DUF447 domain-containing protein n=1 Tax=uncultured Methanobrevibacter sp. TaxID=253161 RepID=UPI0025CDF4F4|nr:DUF447 domain-containing protein [uncultured Methanobrevibacter sp.]